MQIKKLTKAQVEARKQIFEAMVKSKGLKAARAYFLNPKNQELINTFAESSLIQRLTCK
jgi:hypothetical protein